MKDSDYVKINGVNPLYLITSKALRHIKENSGSKMQGSGI